MARRTLEDLFVHLLSDTASAEKQLVKALPRMARNAASPDLQAAFTAHLEETQGQVERIDGVVEATGLKLRRMKCAAMEGLVEEAAEVIEEIEKGPILDAALIAAAQKVEHYEIASYGTLVALGRQLGYGDAVKLLQATLDEEKSTDEKLSLLAEVGGANSRAQTAWRQGPEGPAAAHTAATARAERRPPVRRRGVARHLAAAHAAARPSHGGHARRPAP